MLEARRRQSADSEGMSWRLSSFPSRRTVSSLEKLVTSTMLQKLPRVNSTAREQRERWSAVKLYMLQLQPKPYETQFSNIIFTFDLVGLQIEVLQCGAD